MKYLGIEAKRPRIGVFDLTSCQGCQLQLANREESLVAFLGAIEIASFREISSAHSDDYTIALIDGAVSREDEVERLTRIRDQAELLVAIGSCACFGGVNRLKNSVDLDSANREVYGDQTKPTLPVRPVKDVVKVDLEIPGCPICKAEVERIVQHLVWDVPFHFASYPVCLECKQSYTVCCFDLGQLCLGPITRAGCNAPCPAAGIGCWGCRGAAADANVDELLRLAEERGHSQAEINERLTFFGGFEGRRS
jgi:coenzyme F420-reducing hydrogenase gamma subunit